MSGIYAITPGWDDTTQLLAAVDAALRGGIRYLQYRHKNASAALRENQARALHALCQTHQVPLIINDDLALAMRINAEGVHLGRDDGDCAAARVRWGSEKMIGVSCYADLTRGHTAVAAGASYIAFGACFPSANKPLAPLVSTQTLQTASTTFTCPVIAIGGIQAHHVHTLKACGIKTFAVIDSLFHTSEPTLVYQRAQTLVTAFQA